ncbi:MAG: o-succinylbenzoate--CoA ligase [Chloroflexi bacterium]|nr:o-succinylbenzoate--CoA ligase [Chloroflexota bacterium]
MWLASSASWLPQWLARRAALSPQSLALRAPEGEWTWSQLLDDCDHLARQLAGFAVSPGARVSVLLRNGAPFVQALHALSWLGAVLVPLNWRLTPAELQWQVRHCGAHLLLIDRSTGELAMAVAAGIPELLVLAVEDGTPFPSVAAAPEHEMVLLTEVDLNAVHSIVYTSGTTGTPKGAVLTYGNHWWNALGSALNLGLRDDDCLLAMLPAFHVGGMAIFLRSVLYGCTAIVHRRFDPAGVNRAIDEEGVTMVSVVAAMLSRMLDQREDCPYPPSLRCVLLGGGPAPRPLLERCAAHGIPVVQTYGLTESGSQAVTLAPSEALRKLGAAGKPLFPVQLSVCVDGREATSGETGEIWLRGPSISPGYLSVNGIEWRQPGEWLHTGDLGWIDAEGYLYVSDRRDDLIISGGENVAPAEVEAVLLSHPAVAEAGVTGLTSARWGQVPVAAIVLRAAAALTPADDLIDFCAARLGRYKVPVEVMIVSQLPRTASGKVQRRLLRDLPWRATA